MEERSLEGRVEDLEKTQYETLMFVKNNSELISSITKTDRLLSISIIMLAISQLFAALRPILQHLLGN